MSGTNRIWPGAVLLALLACTVVEGPPEGPRPPADDPTPLDTVAVDTVVEDPGVVAPADEAELAAEDLLARARLAYEAAELGEALDLARRATRDYPETEAATAAAWVGARAAFSLAQWSEAVSLAETFLAGRPATAAAEEARALAELARDELAPASNEPVRLGVVLPRTGSQIMVRYADWLLEGIRLAVGEAEVREQRPIELLVADDAGGTRTRDAVAEVERQGALAVIGPLLPQQLAEAAGARSDGSLLTVSPTIPEHPLWPYVYTVNTGDARGAQELGRYAAELGFTQAALLYPRTAVYERKASAFAVEFETMGGQLRISVPYDSGTTTFDSHMRRILAAVAPDSFYHAPAGDSLDPALRYGLPPDTVQRFYGVAGMDADSADPWRGRPPQEPFALFVAAPDRDVRQIAPQVTFYGLDSAGVQVFGDEAWASAAVRRVVPRQDLEGVIAASNFPPGRAEALADPEFVRRYEESYRRSLQNQLPALGYDAANLVLNALPNRATTRDALLRRFSLLAGLRGATGTFSVRAERVVRTPYLVVIREGGLAPAPLPWEYTLPVPKPPLPPDSTDGEGRR